ncbi:ATP-binding protein [Streptomyces caatingaensis]|uniref:ATP-binding protein n=1 Tax=Streptomyces caatingaensis TaxID=1678637 RepID=UPI001F51E4B0|nr:ATP-binding protein [Streptomyces caatingaensis]
MNELPRSNEYRFLDVSEIEINGRAWVPAFGTKILEQGGRMRVLMVWGQPSARLLLSRVEKDPSRGSLLVAYFGTLGPEARAELAAASDGPLMVVDDAALAYLAAHGNRQVSVTTETLLPFSGVNPYIKEKRGGIGREMFYGRDAERKSIIDPDGTQIIFGGRGLGKSALLKDAGERFAEQQPGYHVPFHLDLSRHSIGQGRALGAEDIWSVLDQELTELGVLPRQQRRKATTTGPYERVRSGIKEWLAGDARRRMLILMDECDLFFEADVPHCTQTQRLKGLCVDHPNRLKVVFAGLHSVQRFTRLARNGPFRHLAQTPTVIGPLAPQFAADLLLLPMRALGFEFADVDLVHRVLGYCSYQPFLLQMFGSRLVEVMQRRRARGDLGGPPYRIGAAEVEVVESDPLLREGITKAFKETLTLDDRYSVIANVLAWYAREYGLETRLSDVELRDECADWWPAGFEQLDSEAFRTYLQEMVGLGVLAPNHDGRGWHVRGPNALRMIGTAQEVVTQLERAKSECELRETVILQGRPELADGRAAPLTVTQVDDLLGDHTNQTRVVLGTPATGIGDVAETLHAVTGRVAGWSVYPAEKNRAFRQRLTDGRPGERCVVVSDLRKVNEDTCRESLELAQSLFPERPGVTRAVVFLAGPGQLGLWRQVLTDDEAAASLVVVLRRHDRRSLKSWTQSSGLFDTEEGRAGVLEVTGGWPVLLDRAVELHRSCRDESQVLRRLADELEEAGPAARLVEASGIDADPCIAMGNRAVLREFGGDWVTEDVLVTAMELEGLEEQEARWVFACLEAFQAFEREGTRLRAEPVLRACWSRA